MQWLGFLVKNNNSSYVIVSTVTYKCELVLERINKSYGRKIPIPCNGEVNHPAVRSCSFLLY
jgi:hypothetical protein